MKILFSVFLPVIGAILLFLLPRKNEIYQKYLAMFVAIAAFLLSVLACIGESVETLPWLGGVFDFSIRAGGFAAYLLPFSAAALLLGIIHIVFGRYNREHVQSLLALQTCAAGAIVADSLAVLIFFTGLVPICILFMLFSQEKKDLKVLTPLFVAIMLLMTSVAITGYIAGTMGISNVADSRLTMNYGWSAAAYILSMMSAFYFMGVFPFISIREMEISIIPNNLRTYFAQAMFVIGFSIMFKCGNMSYIVGNPATIFLKTFGLITFIIASISALATRNVPDLPQKILSALAGLILFSASMPNTLPATMLIAMLATLGVYGFSMLSLSFDEKQNLYSSNKKPAIILLAIYAMMFSAIPPFGDAIRQSIAGVIREHNVLMLLICAAQAILSAAILKCFFAEYSRQYDLSDNSIKNTTPTGIMNLILSGIPVLFLLCFSFGGEISEQAFSMPFLETLSHNAEIPARGTVLVWLVYLLTFLASYVIYQICESSPEGTEKLGNYLSAIRLNRFLPKSVSAVSDTKTQERRRSLTKTLIWDWPQGIMEKLASLFTPMAESSMNTSLLLAMTVSIILAILAATLKG